MTYEKQGLFVDEAHLEHYAENLARGWKLTGEMSGRADAAALRRTLHELDALHAELQRRWAADPAMPGAVRWLLDNRYLARREGLNACASLRAARSLRRTADGTLLSLLSRALLRSGRCAVTDERIRRFLRGVQRVHILERCELDALRAALTAALIEALAALLRAPEAAGAADGAQAIFTALRRLGEADLPRLLDELDVTEQTLRQDPAGVYGAMAKSSRLAYRRRLAALAARYRIPSHAAARHVLSLAGGQTGARGHVGWWIFREPMGEPAPRRRGGLYIAANVLPTLFLSLLLGFLTRSPATALLLLLPVGELVGRLLSAVLVHAVPPAHVPRLALPDGVPEAGRTLCVVSALLTDAASGPALARQLEESKLLSRDAGDELRFALLADLPEADRGTLPADEAILRSAADAIDALNGRYGGGFYLLTRPRTRRRDGRWAGWERKRGALLETMRLLRGQPSGAAVCAGDAAALAGTRFLLALDSDTRLSPGAARTLIGAMLHPLNRPEIDAASGVVRAGYGILAPRIAAELGAATATDFARAFAGQGGTDPYGGESSELYMDLWQCGSYAGKGILDIDAYLACMGSRVPEETMLSHDAVEGAFLRTGYVSDAECSDGFPGSVRAWLKRAERWIRGDWQNLPWLFRRGRALPDLARWKLFDSLRRSLLAPWSLAALLCALLLPGGGTAIAALAALLALAAELLQAGAETLLLPEADGRVRYHAALLVGATGAFLRTLLRLLLLPAEAFTALGAIVRALWRMAVSHRRALDWETAAESSRAKNSIMSTYRVLWPAALTGAALLILSPGVIGCAAGVLWLLSPLGAWALSLPTPPAEALGARDAAALRAWARDTWRYFDEFLTAEDHYLPPDNYQAQPPVGLAHRTSPTNIGLALLSVLGALDLGFLAPAAAFERISASLESLEQLEKWRGHLFNWYDTRTAAPLRPRYVSTVDSGNLCAALIALRGGLLEHGQTALAARAAALADAMDFAPLFDPERALFTVGRDVDGSGASTAWYDLMASEARLTGYLAVARGDVPREHWRALSRAQVRSGPYRGLASWTGTMFEYLMPELLLPLARESLLWESARFCLAAQRRRTARLRLPWGCSESAFASLGPGLVYRYKAHGCAALALKRGMDDELVVSPYSSFLALAVRPGAAMRNLAALERRGLRCAYGFWEALDLTPGRAPAGGRVVRCVMAHHAGMSLVAAVNALCGGAMQRRFFADPAMAAYRGLLSERIITGGSVLRRSRDAGRRSRPGKAPDALWMREGSGTDFLRPACCLLAGANYAVLCTETGLTRARWGAISPYVPGERPTDREKGLTFSLHTARGALPLLPDPAARGQTRSWRFTTDRVRIGTRAGDVRASCAVSVAAEGTGELRTVVLRAERELPDAELRLRFRPLLARYIDYVNHPAFWGLGLSAQRREGALLIRRLPRGGTGELWLALAPSVDCSFDLGPDPACGRAGGPVRATEREFFLSDAAVTARCPLRLRPGERVMVRFALALGHRAEEALAGARTILLRREAADLPRSAAAALGLGEAEVGAAFGLLPALCFPAATDGGARQEALWPFGISGDLPILSADYRAEDQLPAARRLMDAHLFLCCCGADFDLVFLSRDGAGYRRPLHTALSDALQRAGGALLRDRTGGVHLAEDGPSAACIRGCAALHLDLSRPLPEPGRRTDYSLLPPEPRALPDGDPPRYGWTQDHEFQFYVNSTLPAKVWQTVLTNGRFGFLATDCGSGNLWHLNARENPITPWLCQPYATEGPERLFLTLGGERHSLFAAPGDGETRVRYAFGCAVWERRIGALSVRTTAFVPPDADARVLLIECGGLPEGAALHWQMTLQLAPARADARFCRTARRGAFLSAENPRQIADAQPFLAASAPPFSAFTCSRESALALDYDGAGAEGGESALALTLSPAAETVLVCGCDTEEKLAALCAPDAARAALERTRGAWRSRVGCVTVRTPAAALDRLMNGWALYQTLACRLLGRCSVYQSGGAFGFRDQLQDAANLILADPSICRAQILRCCARQYREGDVQHWWHEGDGAPRGVRTRCSDDLLWLPWAVAEYVEKTGDAALLREETPYLSSPPLSPEERDRYEAAPPTAETESVAAHCLRALRRAQARGVGPHGLPRIGSGDWNDGFDAVGGESVWLGWFFLDAARRFSALSPLPEAESEALGAFCEKLVRALEAAWDGAWYRRGYYADGAPLGAAENDECRIDSLAQSWAALSGAGDSARADAALTSAVSLLFDREHRLVKLFDPPFSGREEPGYVRAYGPGFRENGGQYTHGALWLISALFKRGRTEEGWELLSAILPAAQDARVYRGEPFVLAADVCAAAGREGEAGWTWYTGSAGWFFRIVTEDLLGWKLRRGRLYPAPVLPAAWRGYTACCRGHEICVRDGAVTVDGRPCGPDGVAL